MSMPPRLASLAAIALVGAALACGGPVDPISVARWDPSETEHAFPDVIAALTEGNAAQAVTLAQQRLARTSPPDGLQHYLGLALLETGRAEEARDALLLAVERHPGNADAHLFLAEAYLELGQPADAESHLDAATFHLSDLPYLYLVRARLDFDQGRSKEAQLAFGTYLSAEPIGVRAAEAHTKLAQLAAEGGYEDARAQHEATAARLVQSHQFLNAYRARLEQDGNDADALLGLAMVQISFYENHDNPLRLPEDIELKLLEFAGAALTRALEIDPSAVKAWLNLGYVHTRLKQYDAAAEAYARLLELQPDHVPAALNDAMLARGSGDLERARQRLESARPHATDPEDQLRLHGEAALLAEAEGQHAEALAEWHAALGLDPEDSRIQAEISRLEAFSAK
ncbi:MAG: hypothetical protein DHS20C15_05960 [Planctomycetota bacterium]|nr:MAG: hypothetical protein DHS20C15_05960 [Planctomycetota bacterium]